MTESTDLLAADAIFVRHSRRGAFAVEGVSLRVRAGTCVALLGPNGAGKSSLLRALAGLSAAGTTGAVRIAGKDTRRLSARDLSALRSFVPQDNPMPFAFTVREAVGIGAEGQEDAAIRAALAALNLDDLAERSVLTLSGGERQRVAVARAFAQNAPLVLLDEPTASQDLRYGRRILDALRAFVAGDPARRGVIAVLHDLNAARDFADAVLLLKGGKRVASGAPVDVMTAAVLSDVYDTAVSVSPFIRAG